MAGAAAKTTTGLTGLLVSRNPHFTLTTLYAKILGTLEKMPQDAGYRKHTAKLVNERMAIVKATPDIPTLETKINGGQVEELILQAENELLLARKMLTWKPWEPLVEEAPPNQWKWPI